MSIKDSLACLSKVVVESPVFFVSLKIVPLYQALHSLLDELIVKQSEKTRESY